MSVILNGIVAIGRHGEMGRAGALPWPRLDRDMARFARITAGHPVIMGRGTWESLPVRPLPGRLNLILSSWANRFQVLSGDALAFCVSNLDAALMAADTLGNGEAFVLGGARVFREAAPLMDRLYVTVVGGDFPGADRHFPVEVLDHGWVARTEGEFPAEQPYPLTFMVYERETERREV